MSGPQTPLITTLPLNSPAPTRDMLINERHLEEGVAGKPELQAVVLYRYRWFVLAIFSFLSFGNAAVWITFAPISGLFLQFFHQPSMLSIDALSLVYMIAYVPGVFLAIWLLNSRGMRVGLLIAGALTTVGPWLRYLGVLAFVPVHARYPIVLVGQILAACAQAFILQVPPLISNNWFGPKERSLATSIGSMFNQLGVAAGFLISSYTTSTEDQIPWLMLSFAIICTVSYVFCIFGIRDKPPTPPSHAAAHKLDIHPTIMQSIRILANKDFILLLICFGLNVGVFYAISTVIAAALDPFGFTPFESGIIGFLMTVVGIAGAVVAGILTDRLKRYKAITIVVNFGCCLALLWMALVSSPKQYVSMCIAASVFGFFVTAAIPAYFEAAVEYGFPASEDFSGGLLMASAQVVGIVLLLAMNQLIAIQKHIGAMWLAVATSGVTILLSAFLSTNYKRLAVEKQTSGTENDTGYNAIIPSTVSSSGQSTEKSTTSSSTSERSPAHTPSSEDGLGLVTLDDGLQNFGFHSAPTTPASLRRTRLNASSSVVYSVKSYSAPPSPFLGVPPSKGFDMTPLNG